LALAKSHIDIAVYLLQAPPQLLDTIYRVLDPTGQLAHLRLEPVHAKFAVDRSAGARRGSAAACTSVDLPLQHAEVSFQSIETVLHRSILRSCRLGRQGNGENHQQQSWTGMRRGRAPEHPKAS
jgi:hypothetical protein